MRIFKLHGSVDWNRLPSRGVIYQGGQEHHAFPGEKPTDLLLYPAEGKVTMAEPFATLMGWFTEGLREAKTCVAIGYSFRDKDVRRVVLDALATNRSLQLLVVDPYAHQIVYQKKEQPDEPSFLDFPDRVSGLWATAKRALKDRIIRYRLGEMSSADTALNQVVLYRTQRNFDQGSLDFINAMDYCRRTQLPGKPRSLLQDIRGGGEFLEKFKSMAGGTLYQLVQVHSLPSDAFQGRYSPRGMYTYYGTQGEQFGQLVMMWLVAEAFGFEDQYVPTRKALQELIRRQLEGLLFVKGNDVWGWHFKGEAGKQDKQIIHERLERAKQYSAELTHRAPHTLLDAEFISIDVLTHYQQLDNAFSVLADWYNLYDSRGVSHFGLDQIMLMRPQMPGWVDAVRERTGRLEKVLEVWELTSPEGTGLAQNLPDY